MSRELFAKTMNVSRETMERLDSYAALLTKWNKAINLVAPSTIQTLWTRHFLDSAQIYKNAPVGATQWVDLGSGAGFPGLIVACLALDEQPRLHMICIESDQRKSVFLQAVIRELGLNASVVNARIEKADPVGADVVSARALSSLDSLLFYAKRHLREGGAAIFLKGAGHFDEIEKAKKHWAFDIQVEPSKTDPDGAVLVIGDIHRE